MMYTENKSDPCLVTALDSFRKGDVESAIRCLNITFRHSTNTDWSDVDTVKILQFLSRLYFYEGRFAKAALMLESAVAVCRDMPAGARRHLSHLHYNLAECYLRTEQIGRCKKNFLIALDLITKTLGRDSKSFALVRQRFHMVCSSRNDPEQFDRFSSKSAAENQSHDHGDIQFASVHSLTERKLDLAAF